MSLKEIEDIVIKTGREDKKLFPYAIYEPLKIARVIVDAGYVHKDSILDMVEVCVVCLSTGDWVTNCCNCKGKGIILKGDDNSKTRD